LGCVRRVALEHHVTDSGVPETRKQIASRAYDHYQSLALFAVWREVVELASIDHNHSIDPHVRLVD